MKKEIVLKVQDLDPALADSADRYEALDDALDSDDLFVRSTAEAIQWLHTASFSAGTVDQYRRVYMSWFAWCQAHGVAPLAAERKHLERYTRECIATGNPALPPERRRPLAPASAARHLAALSSYYQRAEEDDLIIRSPVPKPKDRPKANRESPQPYLEPGQVQALIAAADNSDRDAALVALLALACLRISEALKADIQDLAHEGKAKILWVTRKGGKREKVLLVPQVYERVMRAAAGRRHGPILATRTGQPLDRKAAWKNMRRIADRAGIDSPIGPHTLRHAYITLGSEMGIPVADLQRAAGHSSVDTTRRYDRRHLDAATHPSTQIADSLIPVLKDPEPTR